MGHSNGALHIVAGGKGVFVTISRILQLEMHIFGRVENKGGVNISPLLVDIKCEIEYY